jgi:uncharacterized protein (TIGR02217 family)
MSFHDVRLETDIQIAGIGGPGFNTNVIRLDSGQEQRVARWAQGRRRYAIQYQGSSHQFTYDIMEFYLARSGSLNSFRYKDHFDFNTSSDGVSAVDFDDCEIAVGDGSETQFQIIKKYTSGLVTRNRNITKPVNGTVRIGVGGVEQGSGWTVDYTTGIVTFSSAPANLASITWGGEFDVHTRFDEATDKQLQLSLIDPNLNQINNIVLTEVIDEIELADEPAMRGAAYKSISANLTLSVSEAYFYDVVPSAGGFSVVLPSLTSLPTGGEYFAIRSNTPNFDIEDHLGNTLISGTSDTVIYKAMIALNSGGSKIWVVF